MSTHALERAARREARRDSAARRRERQTPLTCEVDAPHHSDDIVLAYRGHIEPEILCGFHASQL